MMTHQTIRRILAFTMACALLLSGAQALADQVYVNGSVAVYEQPSESARQLGTLKAGTKVAVAAEKDGWAMLKKGSAVAYVKSSALTRVESTGKIAAYAKSAAPMYKSFSTASKQLGTLPEGAAVTVTARAGDMACVTYGKHKGFVEASKLTAQAPAKAEATEPEQAETPVSNRTVYVAKDGARVYNARGKAVGALALNTELTLTAVKGDICQVKKAGRTGYMSKADLSESKTAAAEAAQPEAKAETKAETQPEETVCATAFVNKDGAKVYSLRGKVIGKLGLNTAVTVTAVKGEICRVTAGGRTAYMKKADLSCEKVAAQRSETAESTASTPTATAYANRDGAQVFDADGGQIGTLKLNAAVTVTAVKGEICKVTADGRTAYMKKADLSASKTEAPAAEETAAKAATGASTVAPAKGSAVEMDWWTSDIQKILARGTVAQITDVATGLSWREQRRGGTNHADCQPMTAADTAAMKKACGGSWSWTRRAIFVTINGVNYAASMNGMPHGSGSIADNNFNGHHCIHFTNSRTHSGNKVCALHQAAIKKAAAAKLG